jgi:predicted alpha/beta superfamily hydrolase
MMMSEPIKCTYKGGPQTIRVSYTVEELRWLAESVRNAALEEAAKVAEQADLRFHPSWGAPDHYLAFSGEEVRANIAAAIRALIKPAEG